MKWLQDNWITLSLIITNIVQALATISKNSKEAQNNKTIEQHRHMEKIAENKIKEKQLDIQSTSASNKLKADLDKLKIQNSQKNYENFLFESERNVFENYVVKTKNAMNSNSFPYNFPPDYAQLQSLIILYCPEASSNVNELDLINIPYEESGTDLSKADYIKFQSQHFSDIFDEIISQLSNELMHR